ncbi:MAG: ComF family protein, partial [Acidimicrobiales bacterium]
MWSVGSYTGGLRRALVAYKYGGDRALAPVFADQMAAYLRRNEQRLEELGLLIPMPAYRGPGARRDWDPVGALFAELAERVGGSWDLAEGVLVKRAETPSMSQGRQRHRMTGLREELRGALWVTDPSAVEGSRVVVVDD